MPTSDERLSDMEIDTIEHHAHGLCASTHAYPVDAQGAVPTTEMISDEQIRELRSRVMNGSPLAESCAVALGEIVLDDTDDVEGEIAEARAKCAKAILGREPDKHASTDPAGEQVLGKMLLLAAAELRQRRAADLSAEDVEALRFARAEMLRQDGTTPLDRAARMSRAASVLYKLIGGRS